MSDGSATATYARIYEEQQPRLVAYARSLTRNSWVAEDLVAEAHFRVWRRLTEGHEIENVPAYLMTTVRHLATAAGASVRETPQDPHGEERVLVGRQGASWEDDPAEHVSCVDLVVRVLGQLPERWVKALWLSEAEGQPLAAIGPQLGTKEGATAVLLHRAREGMRQAFLRAQTGAPDDPACRVHWARMPAYVRGAATAKQSERLLGHVDTCADCRTRLTSLMTANDRLPALVGPALLTLAVGGTAKYLLALTSGVAGAAGTAGAAGAAGAGTASGTAGAAGASGASGASGATGGSGASVAGGASGGLGHGGGLLHGVRQVAVGGAKPMAVAAGAVVVGAAAVCLMLGPGDAVPVPAHRTPVADMPVRPVPVAKAPVGPPSKDGRRAGAETGGASASGAVGTRGRDDVSATGSRAAGEAGGAGGAGGAGTGASEPGDGGKGIPVGGGGNDDTPSPSAPAPAEPTTPAPNDPTTPAPGQPTSPPPADPSNPPPVQPTDPTPTEPTTPTPGQPTDPAPSQPTPTPRVKRPSLSNATVAAPWAMMAGW